MTTIERKRTVPELLTMDEVCTELRVSPTSIRRLVDDGLLPAFRYRPGGPWRFHIDDVRSLLQRVEAA